MSSIHEVAKQAGVSTATVSRTFSTPSLLSQQTRRRVIEVADRLNYRPRRAQSVKPPIKARRSAPETLDAFGFLFFAADADSSPINEFYAPILSGAQSEAARLGMHMIVRTAARYTAPREVPKMFREQAVTGTLLVGAALPDVLQAYASHLPQSVLVDNRDESGRHDSVLSDGFGGAYQATVHLLQLGHRRIGFVLDEPTAPSFRDRRRGYLCAMCEGGLIPDPNWSVVTKKDDFEGRVEALLTQANRPTALLAANDTNALAVMKVCRRLGLCVPEDISLIGFDNISFSVHAFPSLTTLRVDTALMGTLAVRTLYARVQQSQAADVRPEPPVHLIVPVSLVERESCCPPKSFAE